MPVSRPSRPVRPSASREGAPRGKLFLGILVGVAALFAGWLSQYAVEGGPESAAGNATVESGEDTGGSPALMALARRDDGDPLAQGKKDAPVVMIEYADFGCSFCGKFARDTEPELVEKYVDAGVLRIEWRNLPLFGKGSERAARAAWAAGEQGRFWQFHKAAYADEDAKSKGFDAEQLRDFAEQAGVPDLERFEQDTDSGAAKKSVARDKEEATGLGASSTPVFLINGEPVSGAQPDQIFTDAIERAADRARQERDGA